MSVEASERRNAVGRRGSPVVGRREDAAPYRRVGALSSAKRDPATSETTYFIKAAGPDLLEFGEREYFLWRLLDGTNSLADIQTKFQGRFGTALTPEQFQSFVEQLIECGAVEGQRTDPALPAPASVVTPPVAEAEPSEAEGDADATGFRLDPGPLLRTCALIFGPLRFYG